LRVVHVENGGPQMKGAWLQHLLSLKNLVSITSIASSQKDASAVTQIQGAEMERVTFRDSALDDAALAVFATWPKLSRLSLRRTRITDEGTAKLAALKKLDFLDVTETPVTVAGVRPLAKLPLKELGFGPNPSVLEAALPELKLVFPGILQFNYPPGGGKVPVTESQLRALHEAWPRINNLNFPTFSRIEDQALAALAAFTALEELHLTQCQVTDAQLTALLAVKQLRELKLDNTTLGDQGLEQLQGLKPLRKLYISKTSVTDAGVAAFKKKRPDVELVR